MANVCDVLNNRVLLSSSETKNYDKSLYFLGVSGANNSKGCIPTLARYAYGCNGVTNAMGITNCFLIIFKGCPTGSNTCLVF